MTAAFYISCIFLALCYGANAPAERQVTSGPFAELQPACSPDGRWLVFEYFHPDRPSKPQLWIMPLSADFSQAQPLVDDQNYNAEPSWSPDSRWVAYEAIVSTSQSSSAQLFKINVASREKIRLTHFSEDDAPGDSTSWSIHGKIAFEMGDQIYEIDESGGEPRELINIHAHHPLLEPSWIRWSPDGTRLCFTDRSNNAKPKIWIADVIDHKIWPLIDGLFPSWFDNNHILLVQMISNSESKVRLLGITGNSPHTITSGHLDTMPVRDTSGKGLFVARGLPSRNRSNNLNIFEGFHIWRIRTTAVDKAKTEKRKKGQLGEFDDRKFPKFWRKGRKGDSLRACRRETLDIAARCKDSILWDVDHQDRRIGAGVAV